MKSAPVADHVVGRRLAVHEQVVAEAVFAHHGLLRLLAAPQPQWTTR